MRLLLPVFYNSVVKRSILQTANTSLKKRSMGSINSIVRKSIVVDMEGEQAAMIREALANHKVVIFSKTYCPYCHMAKEQFEKLNVEAFIIELDTRDDGELIQNILGEMTGSRTVPRCFINGKFIGGGTDVKRMCETGVLQTYFS